MGILATFILTWKILDFLFYQLFELLIYLYVFLEIAWFVLIVL